MTVKRRTVWIGAAVAVVVCVGGLLLAAKQGGWFVRLHVEWLLARAGALDGSRRSGAAREWEETIEALARAMDEKGRDGDIALELVYAEIGPERASSGMGDSAAAALSRDARRGGRGLASALRAISDPSMRAYRRKELTVLILSDGVPEARASVVAALMDLVSTRGSDDAFRADASWYLAKYAPPDEAGRVRRLLIAVGADREERPDVRSASIRSLVDVAERGDEYMIGQLRKLLVDPDERVRSEAERGLEHLGVR